MWEAAVLIQTVTGWIIKDSTLNEKPEKKKQQITNNVARFLSSVWVRGYVNRSPGHIFLRVT